MKEAGPAVRARCRSTMAPFVSQTGARAVSRRIWRRRVPHGVDVAGLVLAGGRGRRAGGRDKGLLRYHGTPMAARAAALLAPSCDVVIVSANRHLSRYASWADVVTADAGEAYLGPLAGLSAALATVRCRMLLCCPCDATSVPADVPARLLRALRSTGAADVAVARDSERRQPLVMALRGSRRKDVDGYLARGGRSVHGWLGTLKVVEVPVRGAIGNRNVTTRSASPGPGA